MGAQKEIREVSCGKQGETRKGGKKRRGGIKSPRGENKFLLKKSKKHKVRTELRPMGVENAKNGHEREEGYGSCTHEGSHNVGKGVRVRKCYSK